jgi:hypothetical protein
LLAKGVVAELKFHHITNFYGLQTFFADRTLALKETATGTKHLDKNENYNKIFEMPFTLVENRAFVLSSKRQLHRLAYELRLKGFFSTGSSCQRAKLSPWSSSTGLLGTISTGSWHEPVLMATLLHRFRIRTGSRDPAYKYSRPAFSSIFFLWKV